MFAQAFFLALLPLALAQGYGGSGGGSTSSTSTAPSTVAAAAASATPSSDSDSDATSHDVDVGEDGFVFDPTTLKAAVGDTVNFHFYPLNHSVAQSSFEAPCTPLQAGIFSGFHPSSKDQAAQMFTVTINDTNPIWLYCSQTIGSHCQIGMSMVINPPTTGNTLTKYQAAAKSVKVSTSPATIQGGVVMPNKDDDDDDDDSSESSASAKGAGSASKTPTAASSSASTSPTGNAPLGKKVEWASVGVALLATGWAWALM